MTMVARIVVRRMLCSRVILGVSCVWCVRVLWLRRLTMIPRLLCMFIGVWGLGVVCSSLRVFRVRRCRVG